MNEQNIPEGYEACEFKDCTHVADHNGVGWEVTGDETKDQILIIGGKFLKDFGITPIRPIKKEPQEFECYVQHDFVAGHVIRASQLAIGTKVRVTEILEEGK